MKYLLLPFLLAATAAHAQMQPPPPTKAEALAASGAVPTKGANAIIIASGDSSSAAYNKIARVLLDAGYTLDRSDKELLYLNTKSRPAPRLNVTHAVSASVTKMPNGSKVLLKSTFATPGAAAVSPLMAGETQTQYRGMKGSPMMVCWDELQRLASLYSGGQLSYTKQ